ncbi:hypothetical protein C8Q77DRAFT_1159945 [Trametes polyzona]|nr:hypothetical protein C8Q77DRAFT_1159945 [Trametes polyzona]
MSRPQHPGNLLLLFGGVAALGAAAVYTLSPPSRATGIVGSKEDNATAAGHRKEGVQREDANPKMQKTDVREKAL